MSIRLFAIVALLSSLTACGTVSEWWQGETYEAPPTELVEFEAEIQPDTVWAIDAGDGAGDTQSELAVWWQNDAIFAVDYEGEVYSVDAATGKRRWNVDLDVPVVTGIGGGAAMVYVGTQDGELIALKELDGSVVWRQRVTSEVLAPASSNENTVVVRTADGRVSGLSTESGEIKWSYQRTVPLLSLRGASRPVIAGDKVIAGYDNGKLVALSVNDGKVLWEKSIAVPRGRTELDRLVDIDADPVVSGDFIYVVTYHGRVANVEANSGQVLWARDMSSRTGLDVSPGDVVYITDDDGYVWAIQDGSGDALWRQTRLLRRTATAPAIIGDYIVVGDFEGYLHWIARNDGRFVARQQISDSPIRSKPLVHDDVVYVTATDGRVAAVRVPE